MFLTSGTYLSGSGNFVRSIPGLPVSLNAQKQFGMGYRHSRWQGRAGSSELAGVQGNVGLSLGRPRPRCGRTRKRIGPVTFLPCRAGAARPRQKDFLLTWNS